MNIGTKRTTKRDYDADLELAKTWFDERTAFLYADVGGIQPELYEQMDKSIDDALNNEWQRDITIDAWVQRVMDRFGVKGSK